MSVVAQLPACVIGLDACSGAHECARPFARFGHMVKLVAPKFVASYRKCGMNDGNDAEAMCEAVSRPSMRFVPVKSVEQQAMLTMHRVRLGFVEERTATINRMRGLLAEFGMVLPQRAMQVRRGAAATFEQLPALSARALADLLTHVRVLDDRIEEYERELEQHARRDERAKRIQAFSGIGPISASAIVASVADAHAT
jgi:transposase